MKLEFYNGLGTLSFAVNGEELGVAFQGLKPPLYPMADIHFIKISLINYVYKYKNTIFLKRFYKSFKIIFINA